MLVARVLGLSTLLSLGLSAPALAHVGSGAGLGAIARGRLEMMRGARYRCGTADLCGRPVAGPANPW